jgi:hypothetical protein
LVVVSDGGSIAAGFLAGRQQYIRKAMKVKVGRCLSMFWKGARENRRSFSITIGVVPRALGNRVIEKLDTKLARSVAHETNSVWADKW